MYCTSTSIYFLFLSIRKKIEFLFKDKFTKKLISIHESELGGWGVGRVCLKNIELMREPLTKLLDNLSTNTF